MGNIFITFPSPRPTISELLTIKNSKDIIKNSQIIISDYYPLAYFPQVHKKQKIKQIIYQYRKILNTNNIILQSKIKNIFDKYIFLLFNTPKNLIEIDQTYTDQKIQQLYFYTYNIIRTNNLQIEFKTAKKLIKNSLKENTEIDKNLLTNQLKELRLKNYQQIAKNIIKKFSQSYPLSVFTYQILNASTIIFSEKKQVILPDNKFHYYKQTEKIYHYLKNKIKLPKLPECQTIKSITLPDIKGYGIYNFPENQIFLDDTPKTIENKVFKMRTDENKQKNTDKGNPNNCIVFTYLKKLLPPQKSEEIYALCRQGKVGCKKCRNKLYEEIKNFLL